MFARYLSFLLLKYICYFFKKILLLQVLQNVLVEEFTNHMAADAHGEEEAKTKIQAHIDEMNNRLNETNQLNKLSKNDPVEVLGFVIVPAGALEQSAYFFLLHMIFLLISVEITGSSFDNEF